MTKKEMFTAIKAIPAVAANADMVDFLDKEIARLDKRTSTGNSKKKAETDSRVEAVFEALAGMENPATVTEIISSADNEVANFSNQRVSALLRKLIEAGRVVKTIEGKKALFAVA